MHSQIDFGYPWQIIYGHLILALVVAPFLLLSWRRRWPKALTAVLGVVFAWAFVAFLVIRFGADMNGRMSLPTQSFLSSGSGKVLDMGAGTGRSALMVLEARPRAAVVALDKFGESYREHFGNAGNPEQVFDEGQRKLIANMKAAGVDQRVTVKQGDMLQLPFEAASFDAVVSTYAIDHLGRAGAVKALSEAFRVLKPGGEFLMMVIMRDFWLKLTFGPMASHMRTGTPDLWLSLVQHPGFQVVEHGTRPATVWVLARKP